jgi:hypothetical protein
MCCKGRVAGGGVEEENSSNFKYGGAADPLSLSI